MTKIETRTEPEKIEVINKLLKEVYRLVEELEHQVREDLHQFKQGRETDDPPTKEVKDLAGE